MSAFTIQEHLLIWALCLDIVSQKAGMTRGPNIKFKHIVLTDLFIHHCEMKKQALFPFAGHLLIWTTNGLLLFFIVTFPFQRLQCNSLLTAATE